MSELTGCVRSNGTVRCRSGSYTHYTDVSSQASNVDWSVIPLPSFARNTGWVQSVCALTEFALIRTFGLNQPDLAIKYEDAAVVTYLDQFCNKSDRMCIRTIISMHDWHPNVDEDIV